MKLMLSEIAEVFTQNFDTVDQLATGVSTDSRTTSRGDLFFALEGDNFDGHDYISAAKERGAIAAVIAENKSQTLSLLDSEMVIFKVPDTTVGLGKLAHYWHHQCDSKTIAITGSVGKTTVKEMLSSMLSSEFQVCVTKGNFNNQIGLPLTLFRETKKDQVAVIEMGASAENDILQLCEIASPQIGIITQIADAHLAGFGSIEGVATAKSELFSSLPKTGTAIINLDSAELATLLKASSHCRQIKVSLNPVAEADFWAEDITALEDGWKFTFCSPTTSFEVDLNLHGKHNVMNALLALSAVESLVHCESNLAQKMAPSLASLKAVPGRLEVHDLPHQGKLFDDSYNANPTSVKAAIEMLSELSGKKILVLGDMGELGADEVILHAECGVYAQVNNIDAIYTIGVLSQHSAEAFGENGKSFATKPQLVDFLVQQLTEKAQIVVKGSRSAKMEQVVDAIINKTKMETTLKRNLLKSEYRQENNNKQEQI